MGRNKRAFTLIELLVVILIIAILAAIALPQYQKAVDQARFVQISTLLDHVVNAERMFYLAHGYYATTWQELDTAELPNITKGGGTSGYIYGTWGYCGLFPKYGLCAWTISGGRIAKLRYWDSQTAICYAPKTSERAQQICQNVTRNTNGTPNGNDLIYYFR